jgi:hypothetical protein
MKNDEDSKVESPKKLVLRRTSIRVLDSVDLSLAVGGVVEGPLPPAPGTEPRS